MRGTASTQPAFFSYVDIESLIPVKHPLRAIKPLAMETLASMDGAFERLREGRPPAGSAGAGAAGA